MAMFFLEGHPSLSAALGHWAALHGDNTTSQMHRFDCSSGLTAKIAEGWEYFPAVAIGPRIRSRKSLLDSSPSMRACRRFACEQVPVGNPGADQGAVVLARPLRAAYSVGIILEWLHATKSLRRLREAPAAKIAWSSILSRATIHSPQGMYQMAETVSYDVLRRTRVQLDVVAMLLWRKMWATLDLSTVNIFMYADGSPQWRGKELYAVTMDVIIEKRQRPQDHEADVSYLGARVERAIRPWQGSCHFVDVAPDGWPIYIEVLGCVDTRSEHHHRPGHRAQTGTHGRLRA